MLEVLFSHQKAKVSSHPVSQPARFLKSNLGPVFLFLEPVMGSVTASRSDHDIELLKGKDAILSLS